MADGQEEIRASVTRSRLVVATIFYATFVRAVVGPAGYSSSSTSSSCHMCPKSVRILVSVSGLVGKRVFRASEPA